MTAYAYDKNNRVVEIVHPGGLGTEEFGYDEVGNLLGKLGGEGDATLYEYDELNRLRQVYYVADYIGSLSEPTYPQNADVSYTYHGGSRLRATMIDSIIGTSYYEYDEQDRLISYTPPAPSGHASVEYAYNNLGQKTGMSTSGLGLTYEYFANGWLKAVKMGNDMIAEYEYDQTGNRTGINLGNGTHTGYTYDGDPRYRVSGIGHYNGQTPLGLISYPSRDGSGNPLSMIDSTGQISYDYDMNSRLIEAGAANYSYDWVGNRLVPGSAQYDAADQLTSGFGHTYNYDGRGNMIESVGANGRTYTYTPANLLSSVTHDEVQGSPVSSMIWDGDSNRVSFSSSEGGTWQFVYDPTAGIPAVIEEVTPSGSVYYLREPNGALIARISGSDIHYYHFDALGSTRLLTDDTGAITDEYSYDAWGNLLGHTGSTQQPYQYVGRLGYYTHWQDENLDLLQLGVRFYDPESGRFTQVDPLGSAVLTALRRVEVVYSYGWNNPTVYIDPSGLYGAHFECAALCPQLGSWIQDINKQMMQPNCRRAIQEVGCASFFRPNLVGITIYCRSLPGRGQCPSSDRIDIDCSKPGIGAGTVLHEAVHACFWMGGRPPKPSPLPWKCPTCGLPWEAGTADPRWEWAAEKVRHACGYRGQ